MGQPSPPVYIVRAPPTPMPGMPQYQAQTFEPRTREKKNIKIKAPNSNKDVTQEILNRHPSGNLTRSTGGTPNNTTPDISGQSSSSSTPPVASRSVEQIFGSHYAEQLVAVLRATRKEKPRKPEDVIQNAQPCNRIEVDIVQGQGAADKSMNHVGSRTTSGNLTRSTGGTPNNTTPDISGQSSSSSTPVASRSVEEIFGSHYAEQLVAVLRATRKEKPRKPEDVIQNAQPCNRIEVDIVQGQGAADKSMNHVGSRTTSGNLTRSTGGTPDNTTPDISGQSSSSSTPVASRSVEEIFGSHYAEQLVAVLRATRKEKPRKPEDVIQNAQPCNRIEVDIVQGQGAADKSMNHVGSRTTSGNLTRSTGGTPDNTTPDISGQSSSSSTPVASRSVEQIFGSHYAEQLVAVLRATRKEKPRKPEDVIQNAQPCNRIEVDIVLGQGAADKSMNHVGSRTTGNCQFSFYSVCHYVQKCTLMRCMNCMIDITRCPLP